MSSTIKCVSRTVKTTVETIGHYRSGQHRNILQQPFLAVPRPEIPPQNAEQEMDMAATLEPTAQQTAALAALPAGVPVVMVNLLQFKKPDGLQHYLRYGQEVAPLIERAGGTIRWAGFAQERILGEAQPPWWDAIAIVEYPSPTAFSDMVTSADYAVVYQHRAAAVDRADLIATSAWPVQRQTPAP